MASSSSGNNIPAPEPTPEIGIYELKTGDFSVKFTTWGARIVSLVVPNKNGKLEDIVLGYDSAMDYVNDTTYFGATVGRVANRIGGAQFTLNGTHYKLDATDGKNTLHGGSKGYGHVVWKVREYHNEGPSPYITFGYHSYDGEEGSMIGLKRYTSFDRHSLDPWRSSPDSVWLFGTYGGFPGDLHASVTYTLSGLNLAVEMKANDIDKATPVNLAHHSYWNLGGHNSGDILSNEIQIFGSHITPVNDDLIPTGKITSVKGTPYDFLQPASIASKINKLGKIKNLPNGYDINYALDGGSSEKLKTAAIVYDKKSGRVMEVLTNQPGLQFYTGNYLDNVKGKGGFLYQPHAGLCLETQGFPDAVNHPNFPSQIVTPGNMYAHEMLFKFSTKG
ncbi:hypothetical protein RHSIM_Rhsim08G0067800 [Rhododendron simsii]|uniref:Aldose 1-epimerase n=1 Tax=Rhododendron simsii TaxID=118357 RepID=A0A834GGX0_RHOSS|nr:hypothetical protein RHSIM_Rhsim08G0067800 [Rhododendron simsii]